MGGGAGRGIEAVGAGTATTPGRAAGYVEVVPLLASVDGSSRVGVGSFAVCGVTPSAFAATMGLSLYMGIGGMMIDRLREDQLNLSTCLQKQIRNDYVTFP